MSVKLSYIRHVAVPFSKYNFSFLLLTAAAGTFAEGIKIKLTIMPTSLIWLQSNKPVEC